ncbi:hypothetical protein [Streptomyces sp. NPDC051909]|uniref:hypothetical protein n=1 Tax=Streptomyces sp. NPDC051909 TaxID=3154944 RepID=UPI00341D2F5A
MSADLQPPVLHALPDGTYLSMSTGINERDRLRRWTPHRRTIAPQISGMVIRVIEATVTVRAADGTTTATSLRLFTTLLDHQRYPAAELAELYHRRWQAETAYFGFKVTLRGPDRVLCSRHTDDARQELFGLLIVYQAARQIAADAALQAGRLSKAFFPAGVTALAWCSPLPTSRPRKAPISLTLITRVLRSYFGPAVPRHRSPHPHYEEPPDLRRSRWPCP